MTDKPISSRSLRQDAVQALARYYAFKLDNKEEIKDSKYWEMGYAAINQYDPSTWKRKEINLDDPNVVVYDRYGHFISGVIASVEATDGYYKKALELEYITQEEYDEIMESRKK